MKVKAPAPLPDALRGELKRQKGEVMAFLKGGKISPDTREEEPTKPTNPVLAVLSGGREYSIEKIFVAGDPLVTPFYDDARPYDSEAVLWLRHKLVTGPQRIGDLMKVWTAEVVGHPTNEISARIDLLKEARRLLSVEAFEGEDGKMMWRLPVVTKAWPCPHCGRQASIDDVFPSLDKERTLTL